MVSKLMKILLLGRNGQIGWELQRSLATAGQLVALDRNSEILCGDLCRPEELAKTIQTIKPEIVVNAAAYTAVDKAETEPELAYQINVKSVETLAIETAKINALLIHFSSDYVFDGAGSHFRCEDEKKGPLNVYGKTKLDGELAIQNYNPRHLIFRTSWVYATRGHNFPKIIYQLASKGNDLSIVNDQYGAPTSAEFIADCVAIAVRNERLNNVNYGTYHLVANGVTTWFDFTKFIISILEKNNKIMITNSVCSVSSSEYPFKAIRPLNSRLNNNKIKETFNIEIPNWQVGVERMFQELFEMNDYRKNYVHN